MCCAGGPGPQQLRGVGRADVGQLRVRQHRPHPVPGTDRHSRAPYDGHVFSDLHVNMSAAGSRDQLSVPVPPLKRFLFFSRILTLQHGLGMRWAVDVGYITLIYTETVTVLLVRAQFILGSDAWLGGAYDHTYIHTYTPTLYH